VTFTPLNPAAGIKTIVSFAFGANPDGDPATWTWTDVSVYVRGDVAIRKGRPDWSSTADPTQITFTLNNTDGRFTPGNPASPYWPNVVRNVPCRVQLTGFGDPLVAPYERATGFVNGWPLTPNVGVIDVTSQIVASGKLRRLQNRKKPLRSPLFRAVSTLAPVAYWPMEDGSTATQSTPAAGKAPLVVSTGTATFGADGGPGSVASVDFTNGLVMAGFVPVISASPMSWRLTTAIKWNGSTAAGLNANLCTIMTSTGAIWYIQMNSGATWTLTVLYNPPGAGSTFIRNFSASTWTPPTMGSWKIVEFTFVQNGAGIDVGGHFGSLGGFGVSTGFFTPLTLGYPTLIRPGDDYLGIPPDTRAIQMSHVAISSPTTASPSIATPDLASAVVGYTGETAATRITRVCADQSIRIAVSTGSLGSVQAMGPQEIDTFANIVHSAEGTDLGFLHDGGPNGDLAYASNNTRFNAATALALNYSSRHLGDSFAGTLDDQRLVNDSTVSRPSGSSAEYADTSAAIEGDYDEGLTLNVAADSQLGPLAQARVAIGVYPGMRFPVIDLDMVRSPDLAQQVVALVPNGRVTVTGLPYPLYPPGGVDQFIEGWTETISADKWQMALSCSPAGPYHVGLIEGTTDPWVVDAGDCVLNANITATDVSIALKTNVGPILSTAGGDYPRDLYVDGEQIRVTAVSGVSSPQTATVTRSINGVVKSHLANAKVSLYRPATLAL
jgi:hypothetical protein